MCQIYSWIWLPNGSWQLSLARPAWSLKVLCIIQRAHSLTFSAESCRAAVWTGDSPDREWKVFCNQCLGGMRHLGLWAWALRRSTNQLMRIRDWFINWWVVFTCLHVAILDVAMGVGFCPSRPPISWALAEPSRQVAHNISIVLNCISLMKQEYTVSYTYI